jgi:exodeoxyribonuclease-1
VSFVFFDTETTGLKHGFDQIVHLAAIRTNNDLEEIDRFQVRSRLLPHVIPHPGALCTNGLPIKSLLDEDQPSHYDMVRAIRCKLLSWSPSIFVGYNSIRFDEEMLRHALFQTLHSPWLTSNHSNCRADALGLMMAAAALSPACLSIPRGPEGRPVFRLEGLALANGIAHGRAHDAMADVLATLNLCRFVHQRSSELWQRFVRFSKKATVADFVDAGDGFFLTEFFANEAYHTPVVCLGRDPEQPNGRLCLRLDCDLDRLSEISDEELRTEFTKKPSSVRRLRINAAPTITPLYDAPDLMLNSVGVETIETAARKVLDDPQLCARIISVYVSARQPRSRSIFVEEQLYDGFASSDEARMAEFHNASWPEAVSIVQNFDDERLRTFGLRLIYFGCRSALPPDVRTKVERLLTDRLVADGSGALTLGQALEAVDVVSAEGRIGVDGLLADYRSYLSDRIARVSEFRSKHLMIPNEREVHRAN